MPNELPAGGTDGLPSLTTRAFQLLDQGYDVWTSFLTALQDYVQLLVDYYGAVIAGDIGQIEV